MQYNRSANRTKSPPPLTHMSVAKYALGEYDVEVKGACCFLLLLPSNMESRREGNWDVATEVYPFGDGYIGVTVIDSSGIGLARALLSDIARELAWLSQEPPTTFTEETK